MNNVNSKKLHGFSQIGVYAEGLIETGYHEVGADGDPYPGLHGVLRCAIEGLDAQVLFDPLEEELDLPTLMVDTGNDEGVEMEVVSQDVLIRK